MYNERMALKSRLEELNCAEERLLRQLQDERNTIYARLRKLDEEERFFFSEKPLAYEQAVEQTTETANQEAIDIKAIVASAQEGLKAEFEEMSKSLVSELEQAKQKIKELSSNQYNAPKNSKKAKKNTKARVRANLTPLYAEAITYLKKQTASVKSSDIQKEIEGKTGVEVGNMSTFMERLMKLNTGVQKPYRGQYIYVTLNEDLEQDGEQERVADVTMLNGHSNGELPSAESAVAQTI